MNSYIETALWSSTALCSEDEESTFSDQGYTDISQKFRDEAIRDLLEFKSLCENHEIDLSEFPDWEHDFWLTRNGHGAGFWDGDYPDEIGETLTQLSELFPEVNLFLNDLGEVDSL